MRYLIALILLYPYFGADAQPVNDSLNKTKYVFLPVMSRSIETNWTFGIANSITLKKHDDTLTRTSNFQAITIYSLRKQFVIAMDGMIYFPKERYTIDMQHSFSYFPDKWWGIGKNTPDNNEESYIFQQLYIYEHLMRKISDHVYLGAMYEMQKVFSVSYMAGGLFEKQEVVGRNGSLVSSIGFSFTYDSRSRNTAFNPRQGKYLQFKYGFFDKALGSTVNFRNYWLDARTYYPIGKDAVWAWQGYWYGSEGDVPMRSLATLGGNKLMRGLYEGRFRDNHSILLQTEFRKPIWKRLGGVLFAGLGDVGKHWNDFSLPSLKYSYGMGIRVALNEKEKLNIRIDYGISKNSSGLYVMIGETF